MREKGRNLAASVRARLLNHARSTGLRFDLVLNRYALERLLYRLSRSGAAHRVVLKGALLMMTWLEEPHRGTRDLDLLGFGDPDPDRLVEVFRKVMAAEEDDGLVFDTEALRSLPIRADMAYGGVRLRTTATLDGAKIPIAIDVGFGDALEPGAVVIDYPVLLDMPSPRLRAYARETVIAEKFEAMVALGRANSRMKDFYDIWVLSRLFEFDHERLARAISATFARRGTVVPDNSPEAFSADFAKDAAKQAQWRAFSAELDTTPPNLEVVLADLSRFLMPIAARARTMVQP
jgi:predicted nucleotidyltransferase component of viral defense system